MFYLIILYDALSYIDNDYGSSMTHEINSHPEGRWSIIWGLYCIWRQMKYYLRFVLYLKEDEVLFEVCIVSEGSEVYW
jgi:hypothetical protein